MKSIPWISAIVLCLAAVTPGWTETRVDILFTGDTYGQVESKKG